MKHVASAYETHQETWKLWHPLWMAAAILLAVLPTAAKAEEESRNEELDAVAGSIFEVLRTSGDVNYAQEATMGETIALQAFAESGRLTRDQQLLEYVCMVGSTVARVSTRPNTPYYFIVCENPNPNAFAVPGGYVFLTTGLLKLVKNEEELAGVLGHEIAHITLQHAIRGIKAAKRWGAVAQIGTFLLTKDDPPEERPDYISLIDEGLKEITEKGHGFRHEVRADEHGIDFVYRAGYRVQGLSDFIETLAGLEEEDKEIALFKTHRDHQKRVMELNKLISKKRYPDTPLNPTLAARFKANLADRLK